MNILLDTHAYLWFIGGDGNLSQSSRDAIEDPLNLKIISVASLWEITIKHSIGKLDLHNGIQPVLTEHITSNGFDLLSIEVGHLVKLGTMPMHHRDPFDRLLIAQAMSDNLAVCSADAIFSTYDIDRIW
jgi:PIN domain nuclease of toxin-antitoxin system